MNSTGMTPRPHRLLTGSCLVSCLGLVVASGCFEDPLTSLTDADGEESGDGDGDTGDGDGDPGDGDPGDGDGDPGDGDGDPGDGDGDTGDGDGDTGDGDGDVECGPNETLCASGCADLSTDSNNCGVCDMVCAPFTLCGESMCKPEKYVFTTVDTYQGNFSVAQADIICQQAAAAASLPNGLYKAWVSTLASSPSGWMLDDAVWRLRGNEDTAVAYSRNQLFSGELAAPIDRDEYGQLLTPNWSCNNTVEFPVWTATSENGNPSGPDCMAWTSNADQNNGGVGNAGVIDKEWSAGGGCTLPCSTSLPLYCFQQ